MKKIETRELLQKLDSEPETLVIDVLPREHFEEAHLPGAMNIPLADGNFVEAVEEAAQDKNRPIVVYCANRNCNLSPDAAKKLHAHGFTNVFDYEAGIEAWREEGCHCEAAA